MAAVFFASQNYINFTHVLFEFTNSSCKGIKIGSSLVRLQHRTYRRAHDLARDQLAQIGKSMDDVIWIPNYEIIERIVNE
jgi:hypothetical protein